MSKTLTIKITAKDFAAFQIVTPRSQQKMLRGIGQQIADDYKQRMIRGLGITKAGNLRPHVPLSPFYKIRPSGKPATPPPLIDTGLMASSFGIDFSKSRGTKVVLNVAQTRHPNAATDSRVLARTHHFGLQRGLPARPHIGFSRQDAKKAGEMFHEAMKPAIKETFKKGR